MVHNINGTLNDIILRPFTAFKWNHKVVILIKYNILEKSYHGKIMYNLWKDKYVKE